MSDNNPLSKIGQANEEGYHRQQDEALVAKLRQKMQNEAAADEMRADTKISDDELQAA